MRNASSTVLSLLAMALSSATTYLTFFDVRYTLTVATADVGLQTQRGGFSGDGRQEVSFRNFMSPSLILSNRGTRSVVITKIDLVRSANPETCEPSDTAISPFSFQSFILEANTVREMALEYGLPQISAEAPIGGSFDLQDQTDLWCFQWEIYDHAGVLRDPMMTVAKLTTTYETADGEDYPSSDLDIDYSKAPTRLVVRGLF